MDERPTQRRTSGEEGAATALPPGTKAPDFELPKAGEGGVEGTLSLAELRGQPAVLVFYPADWSPVCGDELALFNELLPELREHDAEVVGISVDGPWSHAAFAEQRNLHFPLLADFEPKGEVARRFGVYREQDGISERALFVLDRDGVVRWRHVSEIERNPGVQGVLDALERLSGGNGSESQGADR
jgi:peroxiredoxin